MKNEDPRSLAPEWDWILLRSSEEDAISSLPTLEMLLQKTDRSVVVWTDQRLKPIYKTALKRGLLAASGRVRVMAFDFSWSRLRAFNALIRQASRQFRPTNIFCLDRSFLSALLAFRTGAPSRIGFSGPAAFLYTRILPFSFDRGILTAEKFMSLLKPAGVEIGDGLAKRHRSILASGSEETRSFVALSLRKKAGAGAWPLENLLACIRQLLMEGESLVLIGDSADSEWSEKIVSSLKSPLIKSLVGTASLEEEIAILEASRVLLANDSRDTILASEVGTPVVALFGPTIPEFGEAPWRRNSKVLGVANLSCRPCQFHPPERCPKIHHKCLKDIDATRVFSELKRVIGSSDSNF